MNTLKTKNVEKFEEKRMLILHVTYTAKAGMAREFVNTLEKDAAIKVRAEKGNICYDYFFSAADENKVLLVEKGKIRV